MVISHDSKHFDQVELWARGDCLVHQRKSWRVDINTQKLFLYFEMILDVTQLPWEDFEDIGIVKLGHQKKLLLAIKRIKDILSGKWIAPGIANSPQVSICEKKFLIPLDSAIVVQTN